jgi:uncharacterized protein (TIGR03083 family)
VTVADARSAIAALRRSHDSLVALAGPLTAEQVRASAYPAEWTVAQVLSHLGSGAVIGKLNLDAALAGGPAPEQERYLEIWDEWNAKSPDAQAADALVADRALVEAFEALDGEQLAALSVPFAGTRLDAANVVRMRLAEHAVHSWDVAVAFDPSAAIDPGSVEQIVDRLPVVSGWAGKPTGEELAVQFVTAGTEGSFVLTVSDTVILEPGEDPALPQVALPAEALVRLVYGRLDAGHTPAVASGGEFLDSLRAVYPGF